MSTIYAGPGKVNMASKSLHAAGAGGQIAARRVDEKVDAVSSLYGTSRYNRDLYVEIDLTPFDDWSAIPFLLPFKCVGTGTGGSTLGSLVLGSDPHTATPVPCTIWTPDGRSYPFDRAAVTGHPSIHLGIDKDFFGPVKITCLGLLDKDRDDADFLGDDSLVESSATDTGGAAYVTANLQRANWVGNYGASAVTGLDAIEAEDEWTIDCEATYNVHKAQGLTRKMTLASVAFAAHCRPVAGTHTQLQAALSSRALGSKLTHATYNLVLTGPAGYLVTLNKCAVTGGGYRFGGSQLGTDEIVFYNSASVTAGVVDPLLTFTTPA